MKKKGRTKNLRGGGKKKLNRFVTLLLVLILCAIPIADIISNMTHYSVEFYRISSNKIHGRMRIVFLSDLHLREYGEENADLLRDIRNLSPDLLILGGDLVNEDRAEYGNMLQLCKALTELAPVYGVWGNHEDVKMYQQHDSTLRRSFEETGVRFLTNETDQIEIGENTVALCGIDGSAANFEKYGAKEAMESFSRYESVWKLCIAHVPTYFSEILENYPFDLGLAGHVHGGIIRLPRFGALYSHEEGFFPILSGGEYELKNGAELVVSRGLGHAQIIPRIHNVPELSVIDVT